MNEIIKELNWIHRNNYNLKQEKIIELMKIHELRRIANTLELMKSEVMNKQKEREKMKELANNKQKQPIVLTAKYEADEFRSLIGFTLVNVEDIPEDGLYFTFQNGRNVEIEMLFDGQEIFTTEPYGIDKDGNRIL